MADYKAIKIRSHIFQAFKTLAAMKGMRMVDTIEYLISDEIERLTKKKIRRQKEAQLDMQTESRKDAGA